jgi:hypothetical protein
MRFSDAVHANGIIFLLESLDVALHKSIFNISRRWHMTKSEQKQKRG